MTDDIFNIDEFVSTPPVESKEAPSEDLRLKGILDALEAVTEAKAGADGLDGAKGLDGSDGSDGKDGLDGVDGTKGLDGTKGSDGVSVVDTFVQDDKLFTRLSDGKLINAGNVRGPQGFQGPQGNGGGGKSYRGGGYKPTRHVKTYQFELDNFKKGNTAPSTEYVGVAPRVTTLKFDSLLQRVGFTFMVPLDWQPDTDMQFMAMTAIPAGVTHNVGDIINLTVEGRVARHNGITKLDDPGFVNTTQTTSTTSPYYEEDNYNTILASHNTEYHTYMPSVIIPVANIGGIGAVMYAEVGLNSISAGSVPSMLIYQLHLNYYGLEQ